MNDWYKRRGYPHFDSAISRTAIADLVVQPALVAKWQFYPLIRYIKIGDNAHGKAQRDAKRRPISYASHKDAHLYAFYAALLSERYEALLASRQLADSVIGFRSLNGRSTIHHACDAFSHIKNKGACIAIAFDVTAFFDSLDHAFLKGIWAEVLNVPRLPEDHYAIFKSITRYAWVDRAAALNELRIGARRQALLSARVPMCTSADFHRLIKERELIKVNATSKGIPQGTPISALLSNIYMLRFDEAAQKVAERLGGRYWRYCDDILLVVPPDAAGAAAEIEAAISASLLEVNPEKTEIVRFAIGADGQQVAVQAREGRNRVALTPRLQYLGLVYDGRTVAIRKKSIDGYIRKMQRAVKLARNTKARHDSLRLAHGEPERPLHRRKLYSRYSKKGDRNFHSYGQRVAAIASGLDPISVLRQLQKLDNGLIRAVRAAK